MLETLVEIDTQLLLFFNRLNNSFLDFMFYWLSDKWIWVPFYAALAWLIIRKYKSSSLWVFVFVAAAITVSDQVASTLIKPAVMRLRPCHEPSIMSQVHLVNGYCGGKYGFISSHAANAFAMATFITRLIPESFRGFVLTMFIWAALVSFSRIYLGVHYPGDILTGALLGIISGGIAGYACLSVINSISRVKKL